jgi:hypothetical protein
MKEETTTRNNSLRALDAGAINIGALAAPTTGK